MVAQPVKYLPPSDVNLRFITLFTGTHDQSPTCATVIQHTPSHSILEDIF